MYERGAERDCRDTEQMEKVLSAVIARLPLTPGVYRFRDAAGQVLYLGRATALRRRVASYWLDLGDRGHLGALAFELAGDITSELRALEWVTSPQRASSMAATDFTASGWSGGVLTSFIVRHGQVREWAQAACPESDAAARLAGTPPDWAGFAQHNAELAAAMSSRRGS